MFIIVFLFGLVLFFGAVVIPDSRVRWVVILQNFLLVAGIFAMFSGFLMAIGV